jgi:hypothetical protein
MTKVDKERIAIMKEKMLRVLRTTLMPLMLAAAGALTQARADLLEGLEAHWTLDGVHVVDGQVLDELAAPGYNGQIVGSVTPTPGFIGGALRFGGGAGNADSVQFGDVLDPGAGSFSVALWFNAANPNVTSMLIQKGNASSSQIGWCIYVGSNRVNVRAYDGSDPANRAAQFHSLAGVKGWHHITLVIDREAGVILGYLDGSNGGFSNGGGGAPSNVLPSGTSIDTTSPLLLGTLVTTGLQFAELIDDVGIWGRALTPEEVQELYQAGLEGRDVQGQTPVFAYSDVTPAPGTQFYAASSGVHFTVKSRYGLDVGGIRVLLNGVDRSADLAVGGTPESRIVSLTGLATNVAEYQVQVEVADVQTNHESVDLTSFDTFGEGVIFVEAEDYNFGGGQYINAPQLSSQPGVSNYLDRIGIQGIDFNALVTPPSTQYRIGDGMGTTVTADAARAQFLEASAVDPWIYDYDVVGLTNGEWLNYTRVLPAGAYQVYERLTNGQSALQATLSEVTSGSTTSQQTLSAIGFFKRDSTNGALAYQSIPLTDPFGQPVWLALAGERTLRLTVVSGAADLKANYFMFVPDLEGRDRPPYLSAVSPAAGQNLPFGQPIVATLRNGTTSVNQSTLQWRLGGTNLMSATTVQVVGPDVILTYSSAAPLPVGAQLVELSFQDTAGATWSNQWSLVVLPNQAPVFTSVAPPNGTQCFIAAKGLRFTFTSSLGVQTNGIHLFLNDVDRSADLVIGGSVAAGSVVFNQLATGQVYVARMEATDVQGNTTRFTNHFDTLPEQPVDGLIAHWTLDGADVLSGQVLDEVGFPRYNGTITGSVERVSGLIGGALHFGGDANNADQVNFGDVLDAGDQSFSVAAWIKPVLGKLQYVISKGNAASSSLGWCVYVDVSNTLQVRAYDGSGSAYRAGEHTTSRLLTTNWNHVALVLDREAGVMHGYLNGSNAGFVAGGAGSLTDVLQPGTSFLTTVPLQMGVRATTGAEYQGLIDDVGIWRRALTPEQVQAIYQAGLEGRDLLGQRPAVDLSIVQVRVSGGQIRFSFATQTGKTYSVEHSGQLGPGATWTEVQSVPGDGSEVQVAYPTADSAAYYRVRIL